MFTIYKYTSPSKRNYIGITMYPEVRKAQHRQKEYLFEDTTKFANAIRKYGFESMQYEVIDQAGTIEEACAKEIAWIKFYDSVESGYNILPGGIFAQSITHAERVVEDIRHLLRTTHKTQQQIASMFGVCVSYVSQVKNGKLRGNTVIERSKKSRKGETNGKAKLTDAQIIEIQQALGEGVSRRELQEKYSVSKTLIQLVATQGIWRHVDSEYEYKKKETNGNAVLNKEIVFELKLDMRNGMSAIATAEKYNISVATVYQIKQGRTWKDIKIEEEAEASPV